MKQRPKITDDAIITAAAKALAPKVLEWCVRNKDDTELETIERDLEKALHWHDDGYDVARELEHRSWMPDAALVSILDRAGQLKYNAHIAACKAWVIDTGIQPVPIKSRVTWKHLGENEREGTVTKNDDAGRSVVTMDGQAPSNGYVVEWERLTIKEAQP